MSEKIALTVLARVVDELNVLAVRAGLALEALQDEYTASLPKPAPTKAGTVPEVSPDQTTVDEMLNE